VTLKRLAIHYSADLNSVLYGLAVHTKHYLGQHCRHLNSVLYGLAVKSQNEYIPTPQKPCRRNEEIPSRQKINRTTGLPTIIITLERV